MADPFDNVNPVRETYFINNSERDTGTPANDAGKVAQLESDGKIHRDFLPFSRRFSTFEAMNGSTTPQAVLLSADGTLLLSDANVTGRQAFFGFMKGNQVSVDPASIGTPVSSSAGTTSFTAAAGNNRVILIFAAVGDNSGSATLPTAFTWNGQSFTSIAVVNSNTNCKMQLWALAIGDSASSQTFNIVRTGGSGANTNTFHAICVDKVNQTAPANVTAASVNATGNATASLVPTQYYGKTIISAYSRTGTSNITTSGATDIIAGGSIETDIVTNNGSVSLAGGSGSSENAIIGIALNGVNTSQYDISFDNVVSGFSGLTIGAKYYVSDTAGAIQTTPGTVSILVGTAISATEILIKTS